FRCHENLYRRSESHRIDYVLHWLSLFPDRPRRAPQGELPFPGRNRVRGIHRRGDSGGHRHHPLSVFVEKESRLNPVAAKGLLASTALGDWVNRPTNHVKTDPAAIVFQIAAFSLCRSERAKSVLRRVASL